MAAKSGMGGGQWVIGVAYNLAPTAGGHVIPGDMVTGPFCLLGEKQHGMETCCYQQFFTLKKDTETFNFQSNEPPPKFA